jgi:4-phytase/acid phosphatase
MRTRRKARRLPWGWLLCVASCSVASSDFARAELTLEKVVLISRHGVRSPTAGDTPLSDIARQSWPAWPVPPGYLTPRGQALAALMGSYYRRFYEYRGLLSTAACPAPDAIFVRADVDQRTRLTGAALLSGMFPGCALSVSHGPVDKPDPLFHPAQGGACTIDFERGRASVLKQAGGDLENAVQKHREALQKIQSVLACCAPKLCQASGAKTCSLTTMPSTIALRHKDGGVRLAGPISIASTAAEVFLLEYAQGFAAKQVAWGRASSPAAIIELLAFHRVQFDLIERTPYLAARHGSALLNEIREMLRAKAEPASTTRSAAAASRLTILVGHDTNIANIGGMLDLHWTLGGYLPDETPPAAALAFELLRDTGSGRYFVRLMYYSQTLDQMRRMSVLDLANPPAATAVAIPGCADPEQSGACAWSDFNARVTRAVDRDCVVESMK